MKIKLIVFFIVCTIGGFAQDNNTYKLLGSRKYAYNNENKKISKHSFGINGELLKKVEYFYDENKNKIRTDKYVGNVLITRYLYNYNAVGLKIKSIKKDFKKHTVTTTKYLYNKQGENIQTNYFKEDLLYKTTNYIHNKYGNIIKASSVNIDGKLLSEYVYKYIYINDLISERQKLSPDGVLIKQSKYEYDNDGNKIASYSFYYSGKKKNSKRIYVYENGLKTASYVYQSIN